jgi:AcrR family transcriptional regulator
MSAKILYSKEQIILSTYDLISKEGCNNLTARKISSHLKASTAPIYNCFASIDELIEECLLLGVKNLIEFTNIKFSDRLFLNMGIGIITFARNNSNIYSAIMLDKTFFKKTTSVEITKLMQQAKEDPRFVNILDEDLEEMMQKMWTFIFGLATMASLGLRDDLDDGEIMNKLLSTSAIVVGEALEHVKIKEDNPLL